MNVLFCHDGPLSYDEQRGYYSIAFHDQLMERYAAVFGNVSIVTRVDRDNPQSVYKESNKLTAEKYPVIEYPNFLTLKGIFAPKKDSNRRLEEAIRNCDGLIIRLPSFLGSKCVEIARKYRKPYALELVGCPWDSLWNHGLTGKVLAPYLYLKTKAQVRQATDVLYVTNEFLQRRYPTKGNQVGCSDVELQQSEVPALRTPAEPKKLKLGTLGVINLKYKGHATVLQAMKLLRQQGYDLEYQIVGPGDQSMLEDCALQNGVQDQVHFLGSMDHDKIFSWLDTIDVYIQPSLTEGMPRALIEAMSRSCPCVGSNAGGIPELLDKNYIFPKGNPKALARILAQAADNGLLQQGPRNQTFTRQFSPDVIKRKRRAFYQEFLDCRMKEHHYD